MRQAVSRHLDASPTSSSISSCSRPSTRNHWTTAASVLACLMVVYAVIGTVRGYSSVPFWDMWDGYVDFFLRARHGGWAPWIDAHGEHRLVLSRPFFFADIAWFGGRGILPIGAGILITGAIAATFVQAARRCPGDLTPAARHAVQAVLVGGAFFWSQQENFTWAFQVQFFLVAWLPLSAFYLAARAAAEPTRWYLAPAATACAALATGAMANGIFALPILLVLGVFIGLEARWLIATAITTVLAVMLFRLGFSGAQTNVPMLAVLLDRPIDVLHFTLRYLGGPFWFALRRPPWATGLTEGSAALLLLGTLALLPGAWRDRRTRPMQLAMLALIGYVVVSAFGTALGRLPLSGGLAGALVSRYTTTGGLAWLAFFVAAAAASGPRTARFLPLAAATVLAGLMPWQLKAARTQASILYGRDLAALALATHTDDPSAIGSVYPPEHTSNALATADRARKAGIPAFGTNAVLATTGWLGRRLSQVDCQSGVETLHVLGEEQPRGRVYGHLKYAFSPSRDGAALVVSEQDIIIGWALVRPAIARERGDVVEGHAFSGFIADPRIGDAGWAANSLRICPLPMGASFAYSE